jgi:hypothetical protein
MEETLKSEGKCLYCGQMFSQKDIGKHLAKHLAEKVKSDAGIKTQPFCHVVVEASEMFLHLLVKGSSSMKVIDTFLRKIWLECCGHMSAFVHKDFDISMTHKVEDVFTPRIKIYHDYDFGTTTRVFLKAMKHYQLAMKENITLLSRNEPLKLICNICKKEAAINICTVCCWDEPAFFCEKCSDKHAKKCEDFEDYAAMPVVNSPRMGECGYTGGAIDLERDGVYQKKD